MAMGKIAILIDPEKQTPSLTERVTKLKNLGLTPDLVLLGGSTGGVSSEDLFDEAKTLSLPVWLFPGNENQLSPCADALLLPVVISGRNPDMLIGRHVAAAGKIQALHIPVIPMGYILIDGGKVTSVQQVSGTEPLNPQDKEAIVATALAGEQLGQKATYLEAGSGAIYPVPTSIIQSVREQVNTLLLVGGGIKNKQAVLSAFAAGADVVVIGNLLE